MKKKSQTAKQPACEEADPANRSQSERTRQNIIEVATREFSLKGFSGARVDEIAELTSTSKRMIYYHFKHKEGLYVAVLEHAYQGIRELEATLDLDHVDPEEAIRQLVGFTFDYQWSHEEFVRLVMVENIHHGAHLELSTTMRSLNNSVIERIKSVYGRGCATGVFRKGLDPIDLHMTISALAFFNVSNRYTFSKIFARDLGEKKIRARRREVVIETVLRYMVIDGRS